jgi:membrane-bound serine protease (ClpP class)
MGTVKRYFSLLAVALLGALAPVNRAPAAEPAPERALVYVIPVHDMIERGLLYAFRRGMEEAKAQKADAVVLDIDTPGGKLESAEEMVLILLDAPMPTYAFVNPRAISAGAIISFATDGIYMTPHGLIGDAMPIMMSPLPTGGAQAVPDDLKEKVMSPTIALARSAAQAKGYDPQLAEAMIRPEFEYKIGDRVICPAGQLLTLTAVDAAEPLREGGKALLSSGTVKSLDELLVAVGLPDAEVVNVSITGAERIARVIEGFPFSGILLALGLLGLYIEFKTPGFGFPGIGGLLCLALWFWGHHIAGLSNFFELLLFTVGFILLLTEIFLIPGFGITGAIGLFCMIAAILLSMVQLPAPPPPDFPELTFPALAWRRSIQNLGMAVTLVFLAGLALVRFLPKTHWFHRFALDTSMTRTSGFESPPSDPTLIGHQGTTLTPLRPAGIADIAGRRLDVVAHGAFIEAGQPIVVAEVLGNRIVVDAVSNRTTNT